MSVKFTIPTAGRNVRYITQKITPPIIKFKMLLKGENVRKINKDNADMAETKYILAEVRMSGLILICLNAMSNTQSSEQKPDMKNDPIKPMIPYDRVNKGANGTKMSKLIKLDFRLTSVLPMPLNR